MRDFVEVAHLEVDFVEDGLEVVLRAGERGVPEPVEEPGAEERDDGRVVPASEGAVVVHEEQVASRLQVELHDLLARVAVAAAFLLALRVVLLQLGLEALAQGLLVPHVLEVVHHGDLGALLAPLEFAHAAQEQRERLLVDAGEVVDHQQLDVGDREDQLQLEDLGGLLVLQALVRVDLQGRPQPRRVDQHEVLAVDVEGLEAEALGREGLARGEGGVGELVEQPGLALVLGAEDAD